MKLIITGSKGFLGWHLKCRIKALENHEVISIDRLNYPDLAKVLSDADAIIHIAGVNRGTDEEVLQGNISLAHELVAAHQQSGSTARFVFANSVQSGNGTPYGTGKAEASHIISDHASHTGAPYVDVLLPNLFGEHGRPGYNSFIATFCHEVAAGREPQVNDNEVHLLHVQDAAQALLDGLSGPSRTERPQGEDHGVVEVVELLKSFENIYRSGDIPNLDSDFKVNLFNTYRAAIFIDQAPIPFTKHSDPRGSFVETVRVHGGGGQTAFSTTVPGVTRGEHFHLKKIERFVVIGGRGRISLRKLFSDEVISHHVSGDEPVAIDMPTMWAHNITNIGDDELLTLFWTESVFDPAHPDTYAESVIPASLQNKEIQ